MVDEPDWTKVLRVLYEGRQRIQKIPPREEIPEKCEDEVENEAVIYDLVDLSREEINDVLSYLSHAGLIEIEAHVRCESNGNTIHFKEYEITEKGHTVAHQRWLQRKRKEQQEEQVKSQNEINSAIGFLTLGLLFATFADTWIFARFQNSFNSIPHSVWIALVVEGLVILFLALMLFSRGLLDPRFSPST